MLKYLLMGNYSTIVLMILLFIVSLADRSFQKSIARLFLAYSLTVLTLVIADSLDYYYSNLSELNPWRYVTSALGYSLRPLTLYLIIRIILRNKNIVRPFILSSLLIVNALLAFTSYFTHIIFYFNDSNLFIRGPLGVLPFITSGLYMFIMLIVSIMEFKNDGIIEIVIISCIGLLSGISTFLECAFYYDFILNATMAIGVYFYYLYLHIKIYKRDQLTTLLNRRSFFIDFNKKKNSPMAVISFDLNNLKQINDTQGHSAGDVAIVTFVKCVLECKLPFSTLYRTGGDEFMMLSYKKTPEQIEHMFKDIKDSLSSTPYTVSYGYSMYTPGDDFEKICHESDEKMYQKKAQYKELQMQKATNLKG